MPKKILCISSDGFGAPMAMRLQRQGNEVRFYIDVKEARNINEGLLTKVKEYKSSLDWCDYVLFTNNKLVDIWKYCIKKKPCYGGSEAGQKLESDRMAAGKLAKELGMEVPESLSVKTIPEAEKHLKEHKVKHVLKFCGGNTDSDDILLGEYEDNRDLIRFCHFIEGTGKKWDDIEIQEFIDGIEAGCAAYCDGKKYAPGIEINFQGKRYASGEGGSGVGFLTGEMHTCIRYVDEKNEFFKKTLGPMLPYLQKIGYRGEIDVGTIVRPDGKIFFVENTPRTGCPDFVIRMELQVTPEGELFWGIANGDVKENKVLPGWAVGVVMVSPGFPDPKSSEKRSIGLPIIGYEGNEDHCHLFEARKGPDGLEISAGGYGYPLVVTAKGPTLESAVRRVYSLLSRSNEKRVCVPKGSYRDDVGRRVLENREEIIDLRILSSQEWDA